MAADLPAVVLMDETVIKQQGEKFTLFAAVDPMTRHLLHAAVAPSRNTLTTRRYKLGRHLSMSSGYVVANSRTMIRDTVFSMLNIWFLILKSFPLYLQAQIHSNQDVIADLHKAYYLFFSGVAGVLTGLALMFAVPIIVLLTILAIFLSLSTTVRLLWQLLVAILALFIGSSVLSMGIAVLVVFFRELKHAITTRTGNSSTRSDTENSHQSNGKSTSDSKAITKPRSAKIRDTSTGGDKSTEPLGRVSVPTGDYYEVETDKYGQLKE